MLAVALLYPIWSVPYPPLLDYPNHLARTFVLAHLHDPAYRFSDWYRADWGPFPYLGMDLTLVLLQRFLPAMIAGKMFLSLCLLAVPLSVWWLVRTANPASEALALWGLLLSYNLFFLEGFVNYQLGLAACFAVVTLWLRYLQRPTLGRWLLVLAAATVTYFVHLIAFVFAGFAIFVYTLADRRDLRRQALGVVAFLPGVVTYAISGIARQAGYAGEVYYRDWWPEKFFDGLNAFRHGYSPAWDTALAWAVPVCILLAAAANPGLRLRRPWAIVFLATLALYCALPDEVGESWDIDIRIVPVAFVMFLLVAQIGRRHRIVGAIALLLFIAHVDDVARNFAAAQPELSRLDAVIQALPRDATVLPLINEHNDQDPLQRPYVHFWAYAIVERGARGPYLFDLPGQTTLRTVAPAYIPPRPHADHPPDFGLIRRDYDFVWVYDLPEYDSALLQRGEVVTTAGDLVLYRISRK